MKVKLKVCCIKSNAEADTAIAAGASAIGLVGRMPSGPGPIDDSLIYSIAQYTGQKADTFLLTSETGGKGVVEHYKRTRTGTIQIVDEITPEDYNYIRKEIPGVKLVQVIHVIDEHSVEQALRFAGYADYLLLDSGNPNLEVKELGGTGRTHNWNISRKIVEQVNVPVFLAGGLNYLNVKEAVDRVMPYGIDVCSGVRTGGSLDVGKLERFVRELE